jgi:hypothetical protein
MRYVAKQQFSSRWTDGRSLSVMEGTEGTVPDDDADAIAHLQALANTGQVEILPDDQADDDDEADDDETEQEEPAKAVTPAKAAAKAAPAKAAKAAPAKRAAK